MEDSDNVIEYLLHWNIGMLPRKYNARCNVFEDSSCHLTGWLVENIREVVFRQQRVYGSFRISIAFLR